MCSYGPNICFIAANAPDIWFADDLWEHFTCGVNLIQKSAREEGFLMGEAWSPTC